LLFDILNINLQPNPGSSAVNLAARAHRLYVIRGDRQQGAFIISDISAKVCLPGKRATALPFALRLLTITFITQH